MAEQSAQKSKSVAKKATEQIKKDNERGARQNLIEELFYDFNRSKAQIFWVNFQRGIFFGIGSVLGGALIIAITVMILSRLNLPGVLGDFIQQILDSLNARQA
jgi:hypothetical protein